MTDIVAFLNACLDEDAAMAHAASAFYDDADENGVSWNGHEGESQNGSMYFWPAPHLGVIFDVASGRHITRHDPARVLREVAAKRRVLERHGPERWQYQHQPSAYELPDDYTDTLVVYCDMCSSGLDGEGLNAYYEPWPCPTARDLASAFADHPDYDESWRP